MFRFCVDFHRVNDVNKKDAHPIPRIDQKYNELVRRGMLLDYTYGLIYCTTRITYVLLPLN